MRQCVLLLLNVGMKRLIIRTHIHDILRRSGSPRTPLNGWSCRPDAAAAAAAAAAALVSLAPLPPGW